MKKSLLISIVLLTAIVFTTAVSAQDWVRMMQDPNANFYETQKSFNNYVKKYKTDYREANGKDPQKVPGYKMFKRWEWFMSPRVGQHGERFAPDAVWQEMKKYNTQYQSSGAGSWTFMGPSNTSTLAGAGRLNFIRINPSNSNILYVGAPAGGLWISTNGGSSWTTNTDKLTSVIGCSDLAFDPVDPNIMYLATGDVDGGDNYSVGLLKSTDGAVTWNSTGLSFNTAQFRQLGKVLVDPNNRNNIIVATTGGIYRSTDAAATFSQVQTGGFKDMEFKPGTPTTMYAVGAEFFKSTDGGATWTNTATGLPTPANVQRMAIATTSADPNIVYLVAMKATTYDMEGFYKSTNSGSSFSKISSPNIGNQGFYDLCVASSPSNAQEVMLGGQTQFLKSTNGGITWTDVGGSTHVDYHDIIYTSGTTAYLTSDGGVWKSNNAGNSWIDLSNNLEISQMYGFGQSATDANLLIQGWQDNGTNIYDGSWWATMGGDGMLAFISWNNDNYMWGSQYDGSLNRSTNGGSSWNSCATIAETCPWVTQWIEDPVTPGQVWAGCENVWVSANGGQSWSQPGNDLDPGNTSSVTAIEVSPVNSQVVWTAKGGTLFLSTDGGSTWNKISGIPSGTISDIESSTTDENKTWITYSGFNNTSKVFQTNDQGATWINLSPSVPNIPVNCIAVDKNGNDALYIGTDAGVYFKDNSLTIWQPFNNGIPNVVVTQLKIFYAGNKIRASTYGRGMWESDFYVPGAYAPDASLGATASIGCPGMGIQFSDYTSGQPTTWNWSFPGGTPSSSTEQNPYIGYHTPGTYSVSLTVTNSIGTDSMTINNFVSVGTNLVSAPVVSNVEFCGDGSPVNLSATPAAFGVVRWWDKPAGGSILFTGDDYTPVLFRSDTFYVDEDFPFGDPDFVGKVTKDPGTGAFFNANDIRGLYFDVLEPVIINSFDMYANTDGDRTIEIIDGQGNHFYDTTVFVPQSQNSPTTVLVNIPIYVGNNYFIKLRGLVDCYRNNSGAVYPYSSSVINITESNASIPGYYYFFYNWQYTKVQCNTGRTMCIATDTCNLGLGINNLSEKEKIEIYPNPNEGTFTILFNSSGNEVYSIKMMNTLGQIVYEEKLKNRKGNFSKEINMSYFSKGIYWLKFLDNKNNEVVKKVVIY